MKQHISNYADKLSCALGMDAMQQVPNLCEALRVAWSEGNTIYFCGNGGSAANALHIANDLLYGTDVNHGGGLRVEALGANTAILTCLANDLGYEHIYAEQLKVKARPNDILIVLSGGGNSPNVVKALEAGNAIGMNRIEMRTTDEDF